MRVLCWNVAGLRAKLKAGYLDFIAVDKYDVVCLQETKAFPEQIKLPDWVDEIYPYRYWQACDGSSQKRGLNGVCIWSRHEPISEFAGMKLGQCEGRIAVMEFANFNLVTVYVPNSQSTKSERHAFRTKSWDPAFRKWVSKLNSVKPTLICGDFNVARDDDLDIALPEKWQGQPGVTAAERKGFEMLLDKGFVDVFRELNPGVPDAYTYWNQKMPQERPRNIGWRIDYFLVPRSLLGCVESCLIFADVMGSDHCPVCLIASEKKAKRKKLKRLN